MLRLIQFTIKDEYMLHKSLKRGIVGSLGLLLFIGCAGGGPKLSDEVKLKINESTKYKINNVKVALSTINPADESKQSLYPSETEVASLIKENLTSYLKREDLLCTTVNCIDVDVNMDYARQFILKSNSVSVPRYSYTVLIKDNEKVLLTKDSKDKTLETGFTRNLKIIASVGSDKVNKEDEVEDMEKILIYIKMYIKSLSR